MINVAVSISSSINVSAVIGGGGGGGDVAILDQDGGTVTTVTAPGTYTVEVLTEIVDTITSNTSTIIDPIV